MGKKPTIKTIAELAGVSHVAVSRALRGASDISKETTERIHRIAREIGYTPNAFARNLSSRRSGGIGLIVPAMDEDPIYGEIINIVSVTAAQHGYCVTVGSCSRQPELETKYCRMMCENQVGALIVAPMANQTTHLQELCGSVPLIYLGSRAGEGARYAVNFDYHHGAEQVVEHLAQLGHRSIAFCGHGTADPAATHKQNGFLAAMQARKLIPTMHLQTDEDDAVGAGHRLVTQLDEAGALPDALWCASDAMAFGVLSALYARGLHAPKDISVVGHGNSFSSRLSGGLALTTLELPKQQLGQHAARLALALMDESDEAVEPKVLFKPRLVLRGTTGPAAPISA